MKTTKKACNLVPCLYIVQYMICVCVGGPHQYFFRGPQSSSYGPAGAATANGSCVSAHSNALHTAKDYVYL